MDTTNSFIFTFILLGAFSGYCDGQLGQAGLYQPPFPIAPSTTTTPTPTAPPAPPVLVANINSQGLQGSVEFSTAPSGHGVAIKTNLRGGRYGEQFRWRIYEFPAEYGISNPCQDQRIGRLFIDFTESHGLLASGKDTVMTSDVQLTGPNSVLGRTLVLRGVETGRLACSVIQPTSRVRTYRARMFSPLVGEVVLRQGSFGTSVYSKMIYANGTRRDSTHKWSIMQTTDPETLNAIYVNEVTRCGGLQGIPFVPLTDMGGYVFVGREPDTFTSRSYYVMSNVPPLETVQGGLYVVVYSDYNENEVLGCGRVYTVEPKQASARFAKNFTGEISFRQESPYDPTLVTIDFNDLELKAYSFGVDELPLIDRGEPANEVCPNAKGVIYNPLKVIPETVPPPGKGSADQYAVGDLSGKYGSLQGKKKIFQQVYDPTLSLFGVHSVVGRALVLFRPNGQPMACANIEVSGRRMNTAFSTFDSPIQGQIILRQEKDNFNSDTSIYIELSYPSGSQPKKTYNHPWRIYTNAVLTGQGFSTPTCGQAGIRFNPYNVSRNDVYGCHCSAHAPSRCELGDSSGKMGTINIPPFRITEDQHQDIARYFFTDPLLPLSGPTSIVGRSIVIQDKDFSDGRMVCSNIVQHLTK